VRLTEVNLLGVYVAPLSVIMGLAWIALLLLRRMVVLTGLSRHVWHPALFSLAVYVILVSSVVLLLAR
jgi:hypothetical protein